MGDSQTFQSGIVTIQDLHQRKSALLSKYHLNNPAVSVVKLGTHCCQKVLAHDLFHDVHGTGCNEFLVVLLPERDYKVQDRLHDIHKRDVTARGSGHFIFKLAQLSFFSLAECPPAFSNNETAEDLLLYTAYVALDMQLSYSL